MAGAIDFVAAMLPAVTDPNGIEPRVSALEKQVLGLTERVRGIERDAAAVRVLAGGADNAMREDLNALRQRMEDGFAKVDLGFAEIRARLDAAATGQQYIADLLTRLIDQENVQSPS
jgi:hypothetical protein